jgi:hypothetical protein
LVAVWDQAVVAAAVEEVVAVVAVVVAVVAAVVEVHLAPWAFYQALD